MVTVGSDYSAMMTEFRRLCMVIQNLGLGTSDNLKLAALYAEPNLR